MKKQLSEIPVSVLDLAIIRQGDHSAGDAFERSLLYAKHAESLGYRRYWFAEHHNMESVASSATAVLIGFVAGGTEKIRVGSGGVMLPNHAPLIVAEQFGTLASIYPGRIDLGVGRAPGTDAMTSFALRRNLKGDINEFPNDVVELINYLGPSENQSKVKAIPGMGTQVPVWLLGSSTFSAQLSGMLGIPFAFASHFAPAQLHEALKVYRSHFKPSQFLEQPYVMACVNDIIAGTDEEAQRFATSFYQMFLGIFRNERKPLPPPVDSMEGIWTEREKLGVMQMMEYSFIGNIDTVKNGLQNFLEITGIDEIMIASNVYDMNAKKRSMEWISSLFHKSI